MRLDIIVDTREQEPWGFRQYKDIYIQRDTLDWGDYTLVGQDRPSDDFNCIIERKKNAQELLGNLGNGWDRFQAEAEGLAPYRRKCVIVCGPDNFEYLYDRGFTKIHPNFAYKQIALLYAKYDIPVMFFSNRECAEEYAFRFLLENKRLLDASH